MIRVTKLNGNEILLNAEWIQSVEKTPDTLITLTTGYKLLVKDNIDEVLTSVKAYKRDIHSVSKPGETQ